VKKHATILVSVTSLNVDRFSKFFLGIGRGWPGLGLGLKEKVLALDRGQGHDHSKTSEKYRTFLNQ